MKTDDLITMLAAGNGVPPGPGLRARYASALGWGAFAAMLGMALFLGVRPDLFETARLPEFWVKLAFPCVLLAGALLAALRLSRPGVPLQRAPALIAAAIAVMWLIAGMSLAAAAPGERAALVMGETWIDCLFAVSTLSVPVFGALVWAMKGYAPTRLALAGAAAGLVSGAIAAIIYTLHCFELAPPFVATWYLLGMLIPTALGAVLGPRLLHW